MHKLRILLADDQILFRKSLAALLTSLSDSEIVGEANNGHEAIVLAGETRPDVILMDIHMPECDGIRATAIICRRMPHIPVVMLTISDDELDLFRSIKSGARGYILKNAQPEQLIEYLYRVHRGEPVLPAPLLERLLHEFRRVYVPDPPDLTCTSGESLTDREIDVLTEVTRGLTNKEIADRLHISHNTVKLHMHNILEKLQVSNRLQAARLALSQDIVDSVIDDEDTNV